MHFSLNDILLIYSSPAYIYNLFGVIAQHHPMYLRSYEDKLINLFCYELQIQVNNNYLLLLLFFFTFFII